MDFTKLQSTVRYLGIELDDALELAEQTEVRHWAETVVATRFSDDRFG
jgi:hypothetical protein